MALLGKGRAIPAGETIKMGLYDGLQFLPVMYLGQPNSPLLMYVCSFKTTVLFPIHGQHC